MSIQHSPTQIILLCVLIRKQKTFLGSSRQRSIASLSLINNPQNRQSTRVTIKLNPWLLKAQRWGPFYLHCSHTRVQLWYKTSHLALPLWYFCKYRFNSKFSSSPIRHISQPSKLPTAATSLCDKTKTSTVQRLWTKNYGENLQKH